MGKRKNPETSIDAYKALDPRQLNDTYRQILLALDSLGEATFEEIAAWLKCSPVKIWKRMSELHRMELVYRPGNKRLLKSGKRGFTWMKGAPSKTKDEQKELKPTFPDQIKEMRKAIEQSNDFMRDFTSGKFDDDKPVYIQKDLF
jgi:predicted transcriptional regulator